MDAAAPSEQHVTAESAAECPSGSASRKRGRGRGRGKGQQRVPKKPSAAPEALTATAAGSPPEPEVEECEEHSSDEAPLLDLVDKMKSAKLSKLAKPKLKTTRSKARSSSSKRKREEQEPNPWELPLLPGQKKLRDVLPGADKPAASAPPAVKHEAAVRSVKQETAVKEEPEPDEHDENYNDKGETNRSDQGDRVSSEPESGPGSSPKSSPSSNAEVSQHFCWNPSSCDDSSFKENLEEPSGNATPRAVDGFMVLSAGRSLPEQTRTRSDMFAFADRHVARIHKHFGPAAVERLNNNFSQMQLCSLYSGLGGAEVAVHLVHNALVAHIKKHGIAAIPARAPICGMACEMNSDCHKVLQTHEVARYLIGGDSIVL